EPPREIPLGFLFIASSSALAKAAEPLDELVDMPFDRAVGPLPSIETWRSTSRHCRPSIKRAGRPLLAQYASAQASSSTRSNATPRSPIGISRKNGRTSRLKRLRSIPRYAGAWRKRNKRGGNEGNFTASALGDHLPECAARPLILSRPAIFPSVRLTIHSSSRGIPCGSSTVRPTLERHG